MVTGSYLIFPQFVKDDWKSDPRALNSAILPPPFKLLKHPISAQAISAGRGVLTMTRLHELASFGQSVWFDFIRRSILQNGELGRLVENGVMGVTSNPAIFEKAIAQSDDYDTEITALADTPLSVEEIYETLAVGDIKAAADILSPVYEKTGGVDGYVSLEVSPRLACDTEGTVAEALKLHRIIAKDNVMIKVPATPEGIPAIEALTASGISVNATLIFSIGAYEAVAKAYLRGLEALAAKGGDLSKVASVASIFVSRIDTALEKELAAKGREDLIGKIAVDNSRLAYVSFKNLFSGPAWEALAARGARAQRPLWASTGTKNPNFPDTLYVDELIGPHTVNTVPPATLDAFIDHGKVSSTVEADVPGALERFAALSAIGVSLEKVTDKLLDEGVKSFADAYDSLLSSLAGKRARLSKNFPKESFGPFGPLVAAERERMEREKVVERLLDKDYTLFGKAPDEIANRLGWLSVMGYARSFLDEAAALRGTLRGEGIDRMLLIGMGGSSLAPEVFSRTFGSGADGLALSIADTTVPGAIAALAESHPPKNSVFVVSTKSGGTVETLSLFKYFYRLCVKALGEKEAGSRFVIITDPGSALEALGKELNCRAVFLNDPDIGGRYAALSLVGIVPAVLMGVDAGKLLDRGEAALKEQAAAAARFGAALGALSKAGVDKLTLLVSEGIQSFPDWVEQLVAESTGKDGKGILPVVGEKLGAPSKYGSDRLFVSITLPEGDQCAQGLNLLEARGFPVARINLADSYDLGAQFFFWTFATAVAGWSLGVQPFSQPDVEAAKTEARAMLESYKKTGKMGAEQPSFSDRMVEVYGAEPGCAPKAALDGFLSGVKGGGYIALQGYLGQEVSVTAALNNLRESLTARYGVAVTVGYGPRFLHSTGQLHKGDGGAGYFVQFTASDAADLPIPDGFSSDTSAASFGVVKLSQALGDGGALLKKGRKVIRFNLKAGGAAAFIESLA